MDDQDVIIALMTGAGIDNLIERVDALAIECQQLIDRIAPDAFGGLQQLVGTDIPGATGTGRDS